jgi:hypothetical protein
MVDIVVGPTGAYASLGTAVTSEKANFEAGNDHYVFKVQDFLDQTTVILDYATSASKTITIEPETPADGHQGVWGNGYTIERSVGSNRVIDVTCSYVTLRGFTVKRGVNGDGIEGDSATTDILIDSMILDCTANINASYDAIDMKAAANCLVINCLVYGAACRAANGTTNGVRFINNTIDGAGIATYGIIGATSGTPATEMSNNVVVNTTGGNIEQQNIGDAVSDYNSTQDLTGADLGANGVTGLSLNAGTDFVNPSAKDYKPVVGGKLDGSTAGQEGFDFSGTFTHDITGATRG